MILRKKLKICMEILKVFKFVNKVTIFTPTFYLFTYLCGDLIPNIRKI